MEYKFTERAKKVLEIANDIAIKLWHNYVGTEHLLYGLAKEGSGVASKVLGNQNVTETEIIEKIEEIIGKGEIKENSIIGGVRIDIYTHFMRGCIIELCTPN